MGSREEQGEAGSQSGGRRQGTGGKGTGVRGQGGRGAGGRRRKAANMIKHDEAD